MKVSEIISKEIISIYECESVGTVKDVCLNKSLKKVNGFVFFNDDSDVDCYISSNKIYKLYDEGILIKNTSKIEYFYEESNNPINKKVFSIAGKDCGKIIDIIINQDSNVEFLLTSKGEQINPDNILTNGINIILIKEKNQKISIASFKPKDKIETTNENLQVKIVKMPIIETEESSISTPPKITANTTSLLGKRAKRTIMGLNNEVIVKQNQLISQYTLNLAKKHNKTNELIFNVME